MTTKTKSKKRQVILNVAIEVFREMGFHNASMNIIAARVGGSKSTLYNHFPSKEAIFLEVIRHFTQIQSQETNSGNNSNLRILTETAQNYIETAFRLLQEPLTDIRSTLLHFGENYLSFLYMPEVLTIRRLLIAGSREYEMGEFYYEAGLKKSLMRISSYLEKAINADQLKKADPFIAASHLRSLLEAECYENYFYNKGKILLPERIKEIVNNAVSVFLAAYGK